MQINVEISIARRVIGAIVLGLLAVVILPQLFNGGGRIPDRPNMTIPTMIPAPDASRLSVELPIDARAENNRTEPTLAEQVVTEKPSKTGDTVAVIGVWSLQIASFKDSVNAATLRDGLREAGFRSYNKENALSDGSLLTQVMVGPVQNYDDVIALKTELSAALTSLNISGPPLVVKYSP
jgi:cell division septation protein DedD